MQKTQLQYIMQKLSSFVESHRASFEENRFLESNEANRRSESACRISEQMTFQDGGNLPREGIFVSGNSLWNKEEMCLFYLTSATAFC